MTGMVLQLYSFVVLTSLGVWMLEKAQSGGDVFLASLFFPLSIYLALRVFHRIGGAFVSQPSHIPRANPHHETQFHPAEGNSTQTIPTELIQELEPDKVPIDIDRRLFLKMIGSAGLGLFFVSIFTEKTHAAFFGSLPGTSGIQVKNKLGEKIDPAEKYPTDGYTITEIDDATYPAYYGFLHTSGGWYITKEASDGSYRYAKGASAFSTSWALRNTTVTYGYYDAVFS
ncbi:MAG TPA: hypothetical protein DCX25_03425 [Candidatus Pacebacteria bacterium]|nr:MAG: hypothetical protein UX00_C0001G0055 [Microgenomates group bacterium GW2011_GWB1_45_17]KKU24247.1 MAG: hypothetical protein UX36_C0002G0230 [Microgenomates group bacterium GW2011_GWC1_46_15]KKU24963.1 MAG: hypothetical protein UX35_C0001G0145 [Microgenomates group bacterium GW2011_GWA1_46_15]HAV15356.1 hypothetical protein [Candidatus Paceibacterota bacterium]HCR11372.1 hypothetical protein [Candidatus Paceibacterota bacterium]